MMFDHYFAISLFIVTVIVTSIDLYRTVKGNP